MTAILHAVAGGPLPAEPEVALGHAAGSPFFAEEPYGRSSRRDISIAQWRGASAPLAEVPIPGTIHEVVVARLDRLGPQAKRVVQVAAVIGRQFSRAHLSAILADEQIDVDQSLAELVRRGILHRKTALGGDQLRFGESLTQEIAYEGLLLRQRRQLHERVAQQLERQPGAGPERSALLAHHWSRSDDRRKAAEALLAAARARRESRTACRRPYRRAWVRRRRAASCPSTVCRIALDASPGCASSLLRPLGRRGRARRGARRQPPSTSTTARPPRPLLHTGVMTMTRDGCVRP